MTWRDEIHKLLSGVPWLQRQWGERLTGAVALFQDVVSQGASEAARAPWLLEETSPDDILPLIGEERSMPRYPLETTESYRARLHAAWDAWEKTGTREGILEQLELFGFTGESGLEPRIYSAFDWPTRPPVNWPNDESPVVFWWSKFWIVLGNDLGFGPPIEYDDGHTYDDGHLYDMSGDEQIVHALRGLVHQWKAAHEVCVGIIIPLEGILYDDGEHAYDDAGLTYDGESVEIGC